jgi:hypothetical protein
MCGDKQGPHCEPLGTCWLGLCLCWCMLWCSESKFVPELLWDMRKLMGVVFRAAHGVMFCAQALAYCGVCVCGHVQELHVRPPGAS